MVVNSKMTIIFQKLLFLGIFCILHSLKKMKGLHT